MCIHECAYLCVCTSAHTLGGGKVNVECLFPSPLTLFTEAGSPERTDLASPASHLAPVSPSLSVEITGNCCVRLAFPWQSSGNLKSSSHACMVSAFPTKPAPRPPRIIFIR